MKVSKLKHVILTSMFFIVVIFFLVYYYENKIKDIPKFDATTEPRVVATKDLPIGTIITPNDVTIKDVPVSEILPKTIKDINDVIGKKVVNGKPVRVKVTDRFFIGEFITENRLETEDRWYNDKDRIYALKFDSETTGGFNVSNGELVDIYVLYNKNPNGEDLNKKALDILLSKRRVLDIRDDTGISITTNPEVKPGYLVFSLTYDEISKIEDAKKQGKIYIGKYGSVTQKSIDELNKKPIPTPTTIITPVIKPTVVQTNNVGAQTPIKTGGN